MNTIRTPTRVLHGHPPVVTPPVPQAPVSIFDAARRLPQTMQLFHVFGGTGFVIGIVAHFYLVLVVGIVQSILLTAPPTLTSTTPVATTRELGASVAASVVVAAASDVFDKWTISIFVLVSALIVVGISFLARWSWPIVSEKALVTVLLWLLYGVIVGNFGICICCSDGSWAPVCGGSWYENISSLLWIIATVAAFLVDAWSIELRKTSLVVTLALCVLLLIAPTNNCSVLPAASWLVFLRVTLFHLLWHSNRLQRVAESTAYGIYIRCTRALDNVRVMRENDPDVLPVDVPASLVSTWRVLATIAHEMSRDQDILQHQGETLFATHSNIKPGNRNVFGHGNTIASTSRHFGGSGLEEGILHGHKPDHQQQQQQPQPQQLTPTQTFLTALYEARRGLPHLSGFADCTVDNGGDSSNSKNTSNNSNNNAHWIDWKYRHYSHSLMLAIDTVRATWVLGVCPGYLVFVLFELAWLWYNIYRTCSEIVSTTRPVETPVLK